MADLNSIAAEETKKYLDDLGNYILTIYILCLFSNAKKNKLGGRNEHLALPVDVSVGLFSTHVIP